ncbi:hypothetical protein C8Q80DRAFT_1265727 [Daedaleopsis nitida]|nr:hypothetical protein C8Q80DRAFT_1265727 [Daedaleopsis nitida]
MVGFSASVDALQLVSEIVSGGLSGDQLQQLVNGPHASIQTLSQLRFLRDIFLEGAGIAVALHNASTPIHRLPTEILGYIFLFVRDSLSTAEPVHFPGRWPFSVCDLRLFDPLLSVCRRWRQTALSTHAMWSTSTEKCFNPERAASAPLSIHIIGRTLQLPARILSPSNRIRGLHLRNDLILEELPVSDLEHCKIYDFKAKLSQEPLQRLFSGAALKLRSLYLDSFWHLPRDHFPSLLRLVLSGANIPSYFTHLPLWRLHDLVGFLASSPKLEELYICRYPIERLHEAASVERRATPSVRLNRLRRFGFEGSRHESVVSAIRRLSSLILVPPSCDRYYTPLKTAGPDSVDALLRNLPLDTRFTKMRLDFSRRNLLQLVDAESRCSSVSLSPIVTAPEHWACLLELFASSPVLCDVNELWLAPSVYDYKRIPAQTGIPILFSFPQVEVLAITYPGTLVPLYREQTLETELHVLLAPLIPPLRAGGEPPACPRLKTLCVYLPRYVTNVDHLHRVLFSRARTHPLRRLVIGYDPALELEVLADVFALEGWVEEFVCEEVRLPRSTASDWVLDVPGAFRLPGSVYSGWPDWSENSR